MPWSLRLVLLPLPLIPRRFPPHQVVVEVELLYMLDLRGQHLRVHLVLVLAPAEFLDVDERSLGGLEGPRMFGRAGAVDADETLVAVVPPELRPLLAFEYRRLGHGEVPKRIEDRCLYRLPLLLQKLDCFEVLLEANGDDALFGLIRFPVVGVIAQREHLDISLVIRNSLLVSRVLGAEVLPVHRAWQPELRLLLLQHLKARILLETFVQQPLGDELRQIAGLLYSRRRRNRHQVFLVTLVAFFFHLLLLRLLSFRRGSWRQGAQFLFILQSRLYSIVLQNRGCYIALLSFLGRLLIRGTGTLLLAQQRVVPGRKRLVPCGDQLRRVLAQLL